MRVLRFDLLQIVGDLSQFVDPSLAFFGVRSFQLVVLIRRVDRERLTVVFARRNVALGQGDRAAQMVGLALVLGHVVIENTSLLVHNKVAVLVAFHNVRVLAENALHYTSALRIAVSYLWLVGRLFALLLPILARPAELSDWRFRCFRRIQRACSIIEILILTVLFVYYEDSAGGERNVRFRRVFLIFVFQGMAPFFLFLTIIIEILKDRTGKKGENVSSR